MLDANYMYVHITIQTILEFSQLCLACVSYMYIVRTLALVMKE